MKATIEIPDELYRLVKAKSALEGRAVREVTVALFQRYVDLEHGKSTGAGEVDATDPSPVRATPSWFGILGKTARSASSHEMSTIRESIARGIARDRRL